MAVLLEMDTELEARLNEAAQKRGMNAGEYLRALAAEKLREPKTVTPRLSGQDEIERRIAEHSGENAAKLHDIGEFRGVGKHINLGMDGQEFINQIRDEWDEKPLNESNFQSDRSKN